MTMRLTSSAFSSHDRMPARFTCNGADVSPPLACSDPPAGTPSFALPCVDPNAPGGVWDDWGINKIPPAMRVLTEHWPHAGEFPPQAINDVQRTRYSGPCPPRGDVRHHYHFRLYALDLERLSPSPCAHCHHVENAARSHIIATAELIGLYGRT